MAVGVGGSSPGSGSPPSTQCPSWTPTPGQPWDATEPLCVRRTEGATWTRQASGTFSALVGVSFLDRDRGIAVGSFATILRTDDGGETWGTVQRAGVSFALEAVSFVDASRPSRAACRR